MLSLQVELDGKEFIELTEGQLSLLTRSVASKVRQAMKDNTPVASGEASRSWTPVRKTSGGYSFENKSIQSYSLEYGSATGKRPWPSAGLRTVYNQGRVYSSQAPKGISAKANIEEVANRAANILFEKLIEKQSNAKK